MTIQVLMEVVQLQTKTTLSMLRKEQDGLVTYLRQDNNLELDRLIHIVLAQEMMVEVTHRLTPMRKNKKW